MQQKTQTLTLNKSIPYIKNNIKNQIESIKSKKPSSVVIIQGPPGTGKSDIVKDIAIDLGMGLNTQYVGTMLLEAFGMPLPTMEDNAEFQKWSNPEFYRCDNLTITPINEDSFILLFLDDIHLASKTISNYLFQLLLGRSIHNKKLPNNFVIVMAGNRSEDKANFNTMASPIVNRSYFIEIRCDAKDWIENFAIPNQIRQDIISFIELYPDQLESPPLESKPFAAPRSWTYFAQEMSQMENDGPLDISDIITIGKGHVGLDYTTKFVEYVELFMKWNAKSFFTGSAMPNQKDLSRMENYTLMSALSAELLKDLRDNNWNVNDEGLSKEIEIVKVMFNGLIDQCREIIPMGLRSLILSENITSKEAMLYYKLTEGNDKLLECVKEVMTAK